MSFVMDNVVGTCNLLNYARNVDTLEKFVYFSTDEVFGPAPDRVDYKSGIATTQAIHILQQRLAQEVCLSFNNTYKMPMMITHCMNVLVRRLPEKYIRLRSES